MARVILSPQPTTFPEVAPAGPGAIPGGGYQRIEGATPAAFGGLVGQAEETAGRQVEAGGAALGQAAVERQVFYNQVAADDAYNQTQKQYNDLLFGDPSNPAKPGFYALRGADAMKAWPQVSQQLDQIRESVKGSLANPRAQLDFDRDARRLQTYTSSMIGRHADQQMDTYATAVNKASADTELQTIGANYNSDEAFNSHLEDYKRAKFREAQTLYGANMDPAIGQNTITRATSEAVAARIHGYIAQNDLGGAARVLQQNESALEPTVAAHFHGILSEANVTGAVDRAMGRAPALPAAARPAGPADYNYGNIGGGGAARRSYGSPQEGVGAVRDLLTSYQDEHGLNTISGIVRRWAPPSENDTPAMIQRATQILGVGPNQPIDLHDPATMQKMVEATIRNEHGGALPQGLDAGLIGGRPATTAAAPGIRANFAKAHPDMFGGDPHRPGWEAANLTTVNSPSGATFRVNKVAAADFQGFLNDLDAAGYKPQVSDSGGFNLREIRGGHDLSEHAYGNAIDVNPDANPMTTGQVRTDLPANISEIAARHNLNWGGNWQGRKDPMHFEWAGKGGGQWQVAQGPAVTASDAGPQALATGKPDYPSAIANINRDPSLNPIERQHALSLVHQQYTLDYEIEQRNDRAAEKQLKDQQTANEAELFANAVRKQPLDQKTLADMVQKRQITPAGYNAIMGEVNRTEEGRDNPGTVLHLQQRIGNDEDVTQDIYNAVDSGTIKGSTADTMIKALNEKKKVAANQIERTAFSTLRTIAGMDAQEHPMVDLGHEANASQVALWAQAQTEWNHRVLVNKEPPMAVLADMTPRYGHPVQSIEALPRPRMGAIQKPEDVQGVAQGTQAAFDAGQLTREQFDDEQALILRYSGLLDAQQKRRAAAAVVPGGGGARARGLTPAGTP
jgi:hypothetical protein